MMAVHAMPVIIGFKRIMSSCNVIVKPNIAIAIMILAIIITGFMLFIQSALSNEPYHVMLFNMMMTVMNIVIMNAMDNAD